MLCVTRQGMSHSIRCQKSPNRNRTNSTVPRLMSTSQCIMVHQCSVQVTELLMRIAKQHVKEANMITYCPVQIHIQK
jgi:hypothetical protein